MIIDARNLNITNSFTNNPKISNTAESKFEELVRKLDRAEDGIYIRQDSLASLTSQSTSRIDTFAQSSSSFDVSQIKLIRNKSHYEIDYTADDALSNCWLASSYENEMYLRKCGSKVSNEAVVGMSKSEFLDYVRENGLDKEIDWTVAEIAFRGEKNFSNFTEFTDYCAAFCASLEDRIKTDFSGDEQREQLEILHNTFEKAINDFVDQISEDVNYTFGKLGADMDMDKLAESIRQVIYDKKDAYSEFIKNNSDYADLEGSVDSWLKRDVGYMTDALRKAYTSTEVQSGNDDVWGENDILAIGMMCHMFEAAAADHGLGSVLEYKDEESVGLAIAMNWLATEKIMEEYNVSDSVRGFCGGLIEKYAQSVIDNVNISLTRSRNNPVGASASAFKSLDEDAIYAVLDVMKKSYGESGDDEKAIYDTTSFARNTFLAKSQDTKYSSLWRYNSPVEGALRGEDFWNGFYETNSKSTQSGGMGKLLQKWNRFTNALSQKDDLYSFMSNVTCRMFRTYRTSILTGPITGGYANGKWWGTNLEELVFGNNV